MGKIEDERLLGEMAFLDCSEQVRRAAVLKLKEPKILAQIALKSSHLALRKLALSRLHGTAALVGIVLAEGDGEELSPAEAEMDFHIRSLALKRIENETILANIARTGPDLPLRLEAVARIADRNLLCETARKTAVKAVGLAALKRLEDEADLAELAHGAVLSSVRSAAAEQITSQTVLLKLVLEHPDADLRLLALEKLTDQALLSQVAKSSAFSDIRHLAVKRIHDEALLKDITASAYDERVRKAAMKRFILSQECEVDEQAALAELALTTGDALIRRAALERISDPSQLGRVLHEAKKHLSQIAQLEANIKQMSGIVRKLNQEMGRGKFSASPGEKPVNWGEGMGAQREILLAQRLDEARKALEDMEKTYRESRLWSKAIESAAPRIQAILQKLPG